MRTQLDEIVENELTAQGWCGMSREPILRIATQAWILGVNDCTRGAHGDCVREKGPAPAEPEKCLRCQHRRHDGRPCYFMVVENAGTPLAYTPTGTCNCGDRRKGQKRKDTEGRRGAHGVCTAKPEYHTDFWVNDSIKYVCSRRVQDRRK